MISQATIEQQIGELLDNTSSLELQAAKDKFKSDLAALIVAAIKSATITIPPGSINVVGSATNQSNATPVIVNGGLT